MSLRVPPEVEAGRVRTGPTGSDSSYGANGHFMVRCPGRAMLQLVVSDGGGWEHVPVSAPNRCPVWDEMARVKMQLWDNDDTVIQYHVPPRDKIDYHPFCLHLWRPLNTEIPGPPNWMVGPKPSGWGAD